jgi:hypothetical protein
MVRRNGNVIFYQLRMLLGYLHMHDFTGNNFSRSVGGITPVQHAQHPDDNNTSMTTSG